MECYNRVCTEECDDIKKMYCINRINKEQFKFKIRIGCKRCGNKEVQVIYEDKKALLCTRCGIIRQGKKILEICMVNNRRVICG